MSKRAKPTREATLRTALLVIDYVHTHKWTTSPQLAKALNINARTARHWLHALADTLPIEVRRKEARIEGLGVCNYYRPMKAAK